MLKRVLVIEDDTSVRKFVSDVLTAEGYYVIEKPNAEEGLERFFKKEKNKNKDGNFDIIICDIMMPGANGFEVLKKLKKKKIFMPVFVYITANKEREYLRAAMEAGADDFITKPFTAEELLKSVRVQEAKKEASSSLTEDLLHKKKKDKDEITSKVNVKKTQKLKYDSNIFISNNDKACFVNIKDIILIQSLKDYTKLFTKSKETFYIRKPLKRWYSSLPAEHFIMVNRSELVNKNFISMINKLPNNTHEIILKDYKYKIKISRRISAKLKNLIKNI